MEDNGQQKSIINLQDRIKDLAINIEKMKLAEYVELLNSPWRLLWINFISGIARGMGIAVGFAILGAILLIVLQKLVALNLPVIGGIIADIVEIVQQQMKTNRY
ncbi:MAG: membrane protein [Peptococcaceae bacterium BRH_c4a]|nr:MAG: membrane protein [Peptococcaceae bacterium BRH_c4a]